jgi:RNA polymerase sigma-70 factor (ECF subfamily)
MLDLTAVLTGLAPDDPEALAFAALVRFAEARRPARLDPDEAMIPLAQQDPKLWNRALIAEGEALLRRAARLNRPGPRQLRAALHGAWALRRSLAEPPPWATLLALYDLLLREGDDPFVRLNRAVALAELAGPAAALAEVEALDADQLERFQPYHAVRADLLARLGRADEALRAYDRAIEMAPGEAERLWLIRRRMMSP